MRSRLDRMHLRSILIALGLLGKLSTSIGGKNVGQRVEELDRRLGQVAGRRRARLEPRL